MGVKIWICKTHVYLSICVNGTRWRESTGLTITSDQKQNEKVLKMAELIRSDKELHLAAIKYGVVNSDCPRIQAAEYIRREALKKRGKHSLKNICKYVASYAGSIKLDRLSPQWVEGFQEFLLNQENLTASSAEVYMQAFRAALKKAVRDGLIASDPCARVPHIKTPEKRKEYLTVEEIALLMRGDPGADFKREIKNAFLLAVFTGLRVSDLRTLKTEDIRLDQKMLAKRQVKTASFVYIPLNEQALAVIRAQTRLRALMLNENSPYVFPYLSSVKNCGNQYLIEWGKAAGARARMGWHLARHTFAVLLLNSGADVYTVQRLLGHKELKTTARYAKLTDKKIKEAVDGFPRVDAEAL